MARYYTVEFEGVSVSAAQDFFELTPADDKPIEIVSGVINQYSDLGDAEEEGLRLRIIRGHTASGSGGSVATPRPLNPNYGAASFTCEVNNTAIAGSGSPVNMQSDFVYTRVGWFYNPPVEARIKVIQGALLVVQLLVAPTDALGMSGTLVIQEF